VIGQALTAEIPGFPMGTTPRLNAMPANVLRPGVLGPLPGPAGAMAFPVLQPIGNQPAANFLAATGWPQPFNCDQRQDPACAGMRWPGAEPSSCMPPRPDFYNRFPGATPSGPMEPATSPWPGTSKPWPGGPLLHDGNGGYVVSSPQLPPEGRAPATTNSAAVTGTTSDASTAAMSVGGGGNWWWLAALAAGVYLVVRNRRGR